MKIRSHIASKKLWTRASLVVVVASALGACGLVPTGCDTTLVSSMDPKAQTLRVGQTATPRATLYECGDPVSGTTWQWSAVDTAIVRVNPTTGEVLALRVGSTLVSANGVSRPGAAGLTVTVIP